MGRRPYRVEIVYPKKGKPQYYLAKDVKVRDKKGKVKKYLSCGYTPPSKDDIERYRKNYAYEMEFRVAQKKAQLSSSFYSSEYLSPHQITQLEEIRYVYQAVAELLTTNELEKYEQDFEVYYVQGTTQIEGNTLSLNEAYDLLINDILPKKRNLREINEVQNFKKVKKYRDSYRGNVTFDFIKTLHALIMDNIDVESAGAFRRVDNVDIVGCDLKLTPSAMIEEELQRIIEECHARIKYGHQPFQEAVMFHYKFEMIHPFTDGNGRVGREVLNYMLKKNKYPKLLFLGKDRDRYIDALRLGNEERYGEMISVFADLVVDQRSEVLKANLEKAVVPIRKKGQLRIMDFINI